MIDPMTALLQLIQNFRAMSAALQAGDDVPDAIRDHVVELNTMVLDIQEKAFRVETRYIALGAQNSALADRVAQLEKRQVKPQGYALHKPQPGSFVYAAHGSTNPPDPSQWICESCYLQGVTAPLQREGEVWRCPYCSFRLE